MKKFYGVTAAVAGILMTTAAPAIADTADTEVGRLAATWTGYCGHNEGAYVSLVVENGIPGALYSATPRRFQNTTTFTIDAAGRAAVWIEDVRGDNFNSSEWGGI